MEHKKRAHHITYVGIVAAIAVGFFIFMSIKYLYQARRANDGLIAQQIEQLQTIFKDINACCKINGFRNERDYIDFLNVRSFEGSVVGPMSLLEPQNWKGPYLKENLTSGGKDFQIVKAKNGYYYIVPGNGVVLGNGKIIGKTLIVDQNSDIESMMRDPKALLGSDNKSLAARIETYQNPIRALEKGESKADIEPLE